MIVQVKVGQRWLYENYGHKFILEIISLDINNDIVKCMVVQLYKGDSRKVGEIGSNWTLCSHGTAVQKCDSGATWTLLLGQEAPINE